MPAPQFGRPGSTVDQGTWTVTGAPTAHEAVDEGFPGSTAEFVESPLNPANAVIKFGSLGLTDPGTDKGVRLRFEAAKTAATPTVDLTGELRTAAGVLVAGFTLAMPSNTNNGGYDQLLSEADIAAVTDWAGLQVWITANKTGGTNVSVRVGMVEVEAPGDNLARTPPYAKVPDLFYHTAESLTDFLADTDPITAWQDDQGQGRSWVQNDPAWRPTLDASYPLMRGLPVVFAETDFATSAQGLRRAFGGLTAEITPPFTIVWHGVPHAGGSLGDNDLYDAEAAWVPYAADGLAIGLHTTAGPVDPAFALNHVNGGAHIFGDTADPIDTEYAVIFEYQADPTTDKIYVNDVLRAEGAVGSDNLRGGRLFLHRDLTAFGRMGHGRLHCYAGFTGAFTAAERTEVTTTLLAEAPVGGNGNNRMTGGAIRKPPRVKQSR